MTINLKELIKVRDLSYSFTADHDRLLILDEVTFSIHEGEFLCLIGPSGCGKSTLLRTINGLTPLQQGTIQTVQSLKTAMVFQNFAIFPWLTVAQNVGFGLKMAGLPDAEIDHRVSQQIEAMGLIGFEHKHPKELSGGMRQRVGMARALAVEPKILYLDEPFSALDALTANRLREDLVRIWQERGMTMVMVTHLIEEAVLLADRIVVFSHRPGHVKEILPIRLARPRNVRSAPFYRQVDRLTELIESQL